MMNDDGFKGLWLEWTALFYLCFDGHNLQTTLSNDSRDIFDRKKKKCRARLSFDALVHQKRSV
jgi:hypothetical protein